ncbi:MAG: hemerythrin domain-containing protein [Planctomycetota bacterium]
MVAQPLTRDPALAPLSHGHQRGLRLSARIARGDASVDEAMAAWTVDLAPHFLAEEELLFPLSRPEHVARVRADHEWLRAASASLRDRPEEAELLRAFGAVLEAHVRFEERVWFEALQHDVAPERLAALEAIVRERLPAPGGSAQA